MEYFLVIFSQNHSMKAVTGLRIQLFSAELSDTVRVRRLSIFTVVLCCRFWEQKLRVLIRMATSGHGDTEIDLHAIVVLLQLAKANPRTTKDGVSGNVVSAPKRTAKAAGMHFCLLVVR